MTKRILIAGFHHETNTFSKLPTDMAAFRTRALLRRGDIKKMLRGTATEMAAFLDAGEQFGWSVVTPIFADATPSGPVTQDVYEFVTGEILASIEGEGPFDGILLTLHGAMVCEHLDDGEGELLVQIREKVGPGMPIAVTLDLHANVTDEMARHSNILVSYRTYPHIDQYKIGTQAAELLERTLNGEINPRSVVARGDMLDGVDHGRTTAPGPMLEVLASADKLLKQPGVLATTINAGFPWVDIQDAGPSAVIVYDGDDAGPYQKMAEDLMTEAWEKRERKTVSVMSTSEAMAIIKSKNSATGPIVVSDFSDNPGGGGYGDSPHLLDAMIMSGIKNAVFGTIYDPAAAQLCMDIGLGGHVVLNLGNHMDAQFGPPLQFTGTVKAITNGKFTLEGPMLTGAKVNLGLTVIVKIGEIEVVITSSRYQVYDQMFFKHARIDLLSKSVIVVKSAHHFRAAFGPIASEIILVDTSGGLTSTNFKSLPYKKVRRPVYPLDQA